MAKDTAKPPDGTRTKPDTGGKPAAVEKPIIVSRQVFSDFAMI